MAVPATYDLRIDWGNNGTFVGTGEDVTARVLRRSSVKVDYGRDQARSLSPIAPGSISFTLNNVSGDYTPGNASSPLTGLLLPGRAVRFQATHLSTTYDLIRAYLDDYKVDANLDERSVSFTAFDALAKFAQTTISTGVSQAIQSGTAIGLILDAAGWTGARDLDAGASTFAYWWEEGTDALTAIKSVLASESPVALAYISPAGTFVYRDRNHRSVRAASTTSQATFDDGGTEPAFSTPLEYDVGWKDVVNSVSCAVTERAITGTAAVVYSDELVRTIAAGSTATITATFDNPVTGLIAPVAATDYTLVSGAVTVTLSRTSGQSVVITISASTAAVVHDMAVRGYPVETVRTFNVTGSDSTSITAYGQRSLNYDGPWIGANDAVSVVATVLALRATRTPTLGIRMVSANDTRLTQLLTRQLSDRVTVVASDLGLNTGFFIERIEHAIQPGDGFHETVFGCEQVSATLADVFILDSATEGVLNENVLAY